MRVYAIGDIHGQLDQLRAAHALIAADRSAVGDDTAPVVHLGDLGDRGPETCGVLDFLVEGLGAGAPWHIVRGNHDALFAGFLAGDTEKTSNWLSGNMGGTETLASYGLRLRDHRTVRALQRAACETVPAAHRKLLESLEPYFETDDLILVHAGIRPGIPLAEQDEHDLMWIRTPFLYDETDHGKLVVHGHTPVDEPMHCGNRVALDTGAAWGGTLTAAVFEGRACSILSEQGRRPLPPP